MVAVQLNQVSKKYGRRIGISGIDLTLEEGDIFGLIGPDSAGKTTILRILMNYIFPTDGEVTVFDEDVTQASKALKKDMVYVPADIYFYDRMKIGKYIKLTLKAHKKKKNSRIAKLIQAFDISTSERFEDMDKNDQKKAALAAALSLEPALLLLDEPTRGLEAKSVQILFDTLRELQANGTTVLMTGRDADEYYGLCNRIAIIENGEITVDADTFFEENPECFEGMDITPAVAETDDEADKEADDKADTIEIIESEPYADTIEIPAVAEAKEIPAENAATDQTEAAEATDGDIDSAAAPQKDKASAKEEKAAKKSQSEQKDEKADAEKRYDFSASQSSEPAQEPKKYKNITMKSIGFNRDAFRNIGARVVNEEAGKIVLEYSGDLATLAKLLYDLDMDDICISSKDLQEDFLPFFEGGEAE